MVVGICRLALFFPESGSLKAKRHGLRKIIDRVRAKFNAAIAEVADQDTWQRAGVGFTVVGNDARHVESMVQGVINFIEDLYLAQLIDRQVELITYNDDERFQDFDLGFRPKGEK